MYIGYVQVRYYKCDIQSTNTKNDMNFNFSESEPTDDRFRGTRSTDNVQRERDDRVSVILQNEFFNQAYLHDDVPHSSANISVYDTEYFV